MIRANGASSSIRVLEKVNDTCPTELKEQFLSLGWRVCGKGLCVVRVGQIEEFGCGVQKRLLR
jgi:hypothetical protein